MATRSEKLKLFEERFIRNDIPTFDVGDSIKMKLKVQEADKTRLHGWEGLVIAKRGGGMKETFTVRKNSYGEGVEKTFPVHSPVIAEIKVMSKGKVRRSKLFYLRERTGKKARVESVVVKQEAAAPVAAK